MFFSSFPIRNKVPQQTLRIASARALAINATCTHDLSFFLFSAAGQNSPVSLLRKIWHCRLARLVYVQLYMIYNRESGVDTCDPEVTDGRGDGEKKANAPSKGGKRRMMAKIQWDFHRRLTSF
jgi:hypothetical protein